MDAELLGQIERMCSIILGNKSFNKELDSLALYVGHALIQLQNTQSDSNHSKCSKELFDYATNNIFDGGVSKKEIKDILKKYFA